MTSHRPAAHRRTPHTRALHRRASATGWIAVLALGASCFGLSCARDATPVDEPAISPAPDGPVLVLVLAIDQLRPDRLDARWPGGLGRLMREGRVFTEASLEHAVTETCPGHATMLTGRHPVATGITGNMIADRASLSSRYCVVDRGESGRLLEVDGGSKPEDGRSPRALQVTTLGDWLRTERPASRIYSVSAKDRSAITLGGRHPDGAFWLSRRGRRAITSSRYYMDELPKWLDRWTPEGLLAPVPDHWVHPSGDPPNGARRDAFAGESPRWSIASPHPVKPDGDTSSSFEAFVATPFLDQRTLDFARELIVEERLGMRGEVDLLAIGLSGTDYIGHSYGPFSQESLDALRRLDLDLGRFFSFLDERFGPDRVLVVMTADHGVLPLPEWLAEQGGSCPVVPGRVPTAPLDAGLEAHLDAVFGAPAKGVGGARWTFRNGYEIYFRPARVADSGVGLARVVEVAATWIAERPGVARVWRGSDLDAGRGPEPLLTLYRQSRRPAPEGADLIIEPAYGCLFTSWPAGTSHGSPHDYDRDVPLVFMGPGIEPARVPGRAAPVDIAPTLAAEIGLAAPEDLDGVVLPLRGAVPPPPGAR